MDLAQVFLTPTNTTHRQYEALRAYFVDRLPAAEVAARFGYTVGSCTNWRISSAVIPTASSLPSRRRPAPRPSEAVQQQIVELRKQNQSIYDISEALKKEGIPRTPVAVAAVLKQEGFAKLPRRKDDERPTGHQAHRGRSGRCSGLEPRTEDHSHQVRRLVSVPARAGGDGVRPRDRQVRSAGHQDGPGQPRPAEPVRPEACSAPNAIPTS